MDGINGTVFAYGVTSSGKTHTMLGNPGNPGVVPRAILDVFKGIQQLPNREFLLSLSMMECYNVSCALRLQAFVKALPGLVYSPLTTIGKPLCRNSAALHNRLTAADILSCRKFCMTYWTRLVPT